MKLFRQHPSRTGNNRKFRLISFVVVFAIIGIVTLLLTRAATPTANVEPENGTKSSTIQTNANGTASGGEAVQFKAAAPGGAQTCPPFPAFPDSNCTGVTPGTSLTVVNGDVTITQNGTVYTARDVRGKIYVNASNVTIRDVKVEGGIQVDSNTVTIIEDTEMGPADGLGGDQGINAVGNGGFTCRRCDIHNFKDGGKLSGVTLVEDSYIHNLWGTTTSHNDGFQDAYMGSGTVILRHNVISSVLAPNSYTGGGTGGENGAMQIGDNWQGTITIENNLLDSNGVYVLRLEYGTHIVRNNRWTRKGDHTHAITNAIIQQWTGNAFQDNGQVINQ